MWSIIQKYKVHGMFSCLSGSGRSFKLMCEQLRDLVQTTDWTPILAPSRIGLLDRVENCERLHLSLSDIDPEVKDLVVLIIAEKTFQVCMYACNLHGVTVMFVWIYHVYDKYVCHALQLMTILASLGWFRWRLEVSRSGNRNPVGIKHLSMYLV